MLAQTKAALIRQVEYYFSDENLRTDAFLRGKLDHTNSVLFTSNAMLHPLHVVSSFDLAILPIRTSLPSRIELHLFTPFGWHLLSVPVPGAHLPHRGLRKGQGPLPVGSHRQQRTVDRDAGRRPCAVFRAPSGRGAAHGVPPN